ncbi:uncharacterized protein LOC111370470 [Olea europaea var. sylvestris]|uniref:uncharacterized protein LOC111370470 n=1 Tax=Olea europaea var. sylvestris TaxID=158386 RepID=UPI000C1D7306|nr:uncharacterized protein LOC111370470 [Olea europaea var. sylvestris]
MGELQIKRPFTLPPSPLPPLPSLRVDPPALVFSSCIETLPAPANPAFPFDPSRIWGLMLNSLEIFYCDKKWSGNIKYWNIRELRYHFWRTGDCCLYKIVLTDGNRTMSSLVKQLAWNEEYLCL